MCGTSAMWPHDSMRIVLVGSEKVCNLSEKSSRKGENPHIVTTRVFVSVTNLHVTQDVSEADFTS